MKASHYFVAASLCILHMSEIRGADAPQSTPAAQASENPKWMAIRGTESPNGRYAIAWTLRGQPAVWDDVCKAYRDKEQRDYEDDGTIEIPTDHVENLLVDATSGKILATLFSAKNDRSDPYWEL